MSNPMMEMALKALGIDQSILKQAADIGDTFKRLLESQSLLHVKADRQTEMILSIQVALDIIPASAVAGDMATLIANESQRFMGRTIMDNEGTEIAGHSSGSPGPGIVADAYVKLENLLKIREGIKLEVYRDSLGKLTGGIGHLLVGVELDAYDEGDAIPQEVCDAWFRTDARGAMDAAIRQMAQAGITAPDFLPWLASVNFQLGTNWTKEFATTWNMVKAGSFHDAADHLSHTAWAQETPVRVDDFAKALRALPARDVV